MQTIRRHTITSRVKGALRARFVNKYVDPADWTEKSPGGAATITCGLVKNGVNLGQFKSSGSTTITVADGATLDTDDFTVDLYPGDVVYTITFYQNAAGIIYEGNTVTSTRPAYWDNASGEVTQVAASGLTDQTTGTGASLTGGSYTAAHGGPFALIAASSDPAVLILGDSIEVGIGEAFTQVPAARGIFARALQNRVAFAKQCIGGDGIVKWVASHTVRLAMKDIFTHVFCDHAVNDITNFSRTPAQIVADLQTASSAYGMPFFWRTMTPYSTSTDNWLTKGGQTAHSQAANLNLMNNLMRALPSGITGVFDTSDVLSDGRDTNRWRADSYTARLLAADGLHPNAYASELVRRSGVISLHKIVAY